MMCTILILVQMFPEPTLHSYMVQLLLSSTDEQSLELFTSLITATGKELDRKEAKVGGCGLVQYAW